MPPKKSTKAAPAKEKTKEEIKQDDSAMKEEVKQDVEDAKEEVKQDVEDTKDEDKKPVKETKRKTAASKTDTNEPPSKAPRRGRSGASSAVAPSKLIAFLASQEAAELLRPKDEGAMLSDSPDAITYTSNVPLSPFLELMSSLILSRPISSHTLGFRSIRTLMNPPWSYTSPKALLEPSHQPEKTPKDGEAAKLAADGGGGEPARIVYMALEEARTQHKAKTASQLIGLAETCIAEFCESDDDVEMLKLRKQVEEAGDDAGDVLEDLVKKHVKGVGQTGAEIFRRRLQGCAGWEAVGPFIDGRTKTALDRMGLSSDAEQLLKQIDEADVKGEDGKWKTFVVVMERAVEAELQGVVDEVMKNAGGS